MTKGYDIIIVGGGPAGLTAALYSLRSDKRVLVIEKNNFGGQIALSPRVENFPGTASMSGNAFAAHLMEQVSELGCEFELCEVLGIESFPTHKLVHTDDGDFTAKAVILATGAKHRQLGLPREEEFTGNGVSYCAVCDGAFFNECNVAVSGGGDSALQDAVVLSEICEKVYIIHRRDEFRAEAANINAVMARKNIILKMCSNIIELRGETELSSIVIENQNSGLSEEIQVDGLFIEVGFCPENEPFAAVAALDPDGWFAAGEDCFSGTDGIFVAGDCRAKSVRQLTTATADGAVAAVAACRFLNTK